MLSKHGQVDRDLLPNLGEKVVAMGLQDHLRLEVEDAGQVVAGLVLIGRLAVGDLVLVAIAGLKEIAWRINEGIYEGVGTGTQSTKLRFEALREEAYSRGL